MAILFILFNLVISFFIIRTSGVSRLKWYFCGIALTHPWICVSSSSLFFFGHNIFMVSFVLSMCFHQEMRSFLYHKWLFKPLIVLISLSYIGIGLFDYRHSVGIGLYRGLLYSLNTYFLFYTGLCSIKNIHDFNNFAKKLSVIIFIVVVWGTITFFLKYNPYTEFVGSSFGFDARFAEAEDVTLGYRAFRVTSFFNDAGVYGMMAACYFFFILSIKKLHIISDSANKIILLLCFVNVIFCATRGSIISFFFGLILWMFLSFSFGTIYSMILRGLFVILLIVLVMPSSVFQYFDSVTDSILEVFSSSGGAATGGSTVELRNLQYITAFEYWKEMPWWGHGFEYWKENIIVRLSNQMQGGLAGMESYICFLLLEYGGIHTFFVSCFFVYSTFWIWKQRTIDRKVANIGFVINCMVILFMLTGWCRGIWSIWLPITGVLCKYIQIKKYQYA